jgi:DNA-binding MarR family transcriptional regulator
MAVGRRIAADDSATFMDPKLRAWALVSELYWMSYKLLERQLYYLDVSVSQARVIALLYFAEGSMQPSQIAMLLFQETQSITGILSRIEEHDWVRRSPHPDDRRAINLELTPEGRRVAAQVVAISEDLYAELFAPAMTVAERRALETALRKVRSASFKLPETDFKLRRARQHPLWSD